MTSQNDPQKAGPDLDRDGFFRRMIADLAETLQDVVGQRDARGFISIIGARMGDRIDSLYRQQHGKDVLSRPEVAETLVDLKTRIGGDFHIVEQDDEKIVLRNRKCPFGSMVTGKPALCMMTSNVFGRIAAENLGYARVEIEESIAQGHPGCSVVVSLRQSEDGTETGIEYFGRDNDG